MAAAAAATGKTEALPSAATAHIGAKSCVRIIDQGRHEIVPYQTAVDTYDAAYNILINANRFDDNEVKDDSPKPTQELLQYMRTCFEKAINALQPNNELKQNANTILENINKIIQNAVPTAAAAAPAPAPAPPHFDTGFLINASEILHTIALELAKPAVNLPKNIIASAASAADGGKSGGRRKRNTRHKHKKNKNKTRVGHR